MFSEYIVICVEDHPLVQLAKWTTNGITKCLCYYEHRMGHQSLTFASILWDNLIVLKWPQPISLNWLYSPPISSAVSRVIASKYISVQRLCSNVLFSYPGYTYSPSLWNVKTVTFYIEASHFCEHVNPSPIADLSSRKDRVSEEQGLMGNWRLREH